MTVLSVPVNVSKPRNFEAELAPYSCAAHLMRERPIAHAISAIQHESPDDWGGEDFSVNILSHDGLPAIELAVTWCPTRKMARKLKDVSMQHVPMLLIRHLTRTQRVCCTRE